MLDLLKPDSPVQRGAGSTMRYLVLLPLAALLASYFVVWRAAPLLTSDSFGYMRLAEDIENHTLTEFHQRTIGYPLVLLLAGAGQHPTRLLFLLTLALHFSTVLCLVYLLGTLRTRPALVVAFAIVALLPPMVAPAAYVMTETLTSFTLVLTYCLLIAWLNRNRARLAAVFVVAGLFCVLVRPTFQVLIPFLLFWLLLLRASGLIPPVRLVRLFVLFGVAGAVCGSILLATSILNYRHFGFFAVTSLGPYQLTTRTVSVVEYLPGPYSGLREILISHRDRYLTQPFDDHTGLDYIYRAFPDVKRYYGGSTVKALRAIQEAGLYLILHKPASYLNECMKAAATFWMPDDEPLAYGNSGGLKLLWTGLDLAIVILFFGQLLAAGGLLVFLASLRTRNAAVADFIRSHIALVGAYSIGIGIIFYNMVVSCSLGIGAARYRVPTDLLILATTIMAYGLFSGARASWGNTNSKRCV